MKITEFKRLIDLYEASSISKDAEVVVVMAETGIPAAPTVNVIGVSQGFDWNHGKIMLRTEQPVVRKKTK